MAVLPVADLVPAAGFGVAAAVVGAGVAGLAALGSGAGVAAGSAAGADSAGAGEAASVWSAFDCDESSLVEPPEQPDPTRASALINAR